MEKIRNFGGFLKYVIDVRQLMVVTVRMLCIVLMLICAMRYQHNRDNLRFEAELEELARVAAEEEEARARAAEISAGIDVRVTEAEEVAKVLYGTARNNSPEDQRLVVWCIINRVEHQSYPDNIVDVCQQESQWMGYSQDNPIIESLYEIAYTELTAYHSGNHRPIPPEYVFLSWTESEIVLRDKFEEKGSVHYWRA